MCFSYKSSKPLIHKKTLIYVQSQECAHLPEVFVAFTCFYQRLIDHPQQIQQMQDQAMVNRKFAPSWSNLSDVADYQLSWDESIWIQMNPDESRWIQMNPDESRSHVVVNWSPPTSTNSCDVWLPGTIRCMAALWRKRIGPLCTSARVSLDAMRASVPKGLFPGEKQRLKNGGMLKICPKHAPRFEMFGHICMTNSHSPTFWMFKHIFWHMSVNKVMIQTIATEGGVPFGHFTS